MKGTWAPGHHALAIKEYMNFIQWGCPRGQGKHCPFQIYARSFFPYCLHLLISSWLPDFRHYPLIWQVQRYSTCAVSALMQMFPWSASFPAPDVASQPHLPFGPSPNTLYQMPAWLKAVGKHQKYFQGPNCKLHFNFLCILIAESMPTWHMLNYSVSLVDKRV